MVDWYLKEEAEKIEDDPQYRGDHDLKVPVFFYTGWKWKQDTAYLTQEQYEDLEPAGMKHGHEVWRLDS